MHWLQDVDNVYGYGNAPGECEAGPTDTGPSYINTFQRGPQESVWETVPQPTCDDFKYGGKNGYLDLFTGDASYAKQWKFTNAPDADARAVQAAYWARQWAKAQGKGARRLRRPSPRPRKMGDYLRYAMYDKYFKKIGNCVGPTACPAGTGKDSLALPAVLVLRLGRRHRHRGGLGLAHRLQPRPRRLPEPAGGLRAELRTPTLKPKSATGAARLEHQPRRGSWSSTAGCSPPRAPSPAARPTAGRAATRPRRPGTSTFYGMYYDQQPVYHDPPSNQWFGFQAWSMERVAEYYQQTGDAQAKAVLDKWVDVGAVQDHDQPGRHLPDPVRRSSGRGQPDTWNAVQPRRQHRPARHRRRLHQRRRRGRRVRQDPDVLRAPSPATPRPRRRPRRCWTACGTTTRTAWASRSRRPAPTTTASTTAVLRPERLDRHHAERRHDRLRLDLRVDPVLLQERPGLVEGPGLPERAARRRPSPTTGSGPRRTSPWPWARTRSFSNSPRRALRGLGGGSGCGPAVAGRAVPRAPGGAHGAPRFLGTA